MAVGLCPWQLGLLVRQRVVRILHPHPTSSSLLLGPAGFGPQGLEVEVQRLIARHRSELAGAQEAGEAEAARRLEAQRVQHEGELRLQRERLAKVCSVRARARARVCVCVCVG